MAARSLWYLSPLPPLGSPVLSAALHLFSPRGLEETGGSVFLPLPRILQQVCSRGRRARNEKGGGRVYWKNHLSLVPLPLPVRLDGEVPYLMWGGGDLCVCTLKEICVCGCIFSLGKRFFPPENISVPVFGGGRIWMRKSEVSK